jgi:hypothetical protein
MVRDNPFVPFVKSFVSSVVKHVRLNRKGHKEFHRGREGKMLKGKLARRIILKNVHRAIGFNWHIG